MGSFSSRYLETIDSGFLSTPSFRLHYLQKGDGHPLILVHGGGMWLYTFRNNITELSRRFRVYALDMPGYGYTTPLIKDQRYGLETAADALLDFMNFLGIGRASLLGHSWGGGWCIHFTSLHPERVEKLILIDSSGFDVPDVPEWELLKLPLIGPMLLRFVTPSAVKKRLEHSFYHREAVTLDMAEEVYIPLTFRHNRKAQIQIARNQDWSLTEKAIPGIQKPTLVLWGDHDRYLDIRLQSRFRQHLKYYQGNVFEDCGHSLHEEYPHRANMIITEFLSKT